MTLGVGLAEVADGELDVGLQGGDGFVTKQLFDVVEVGVGADQLGSTAAAEGVGRDVDV